MGIHAKIPSEFAQQAERRVWFDRQHAEQMLDWIEDSGQRFLGMDVAQKQDDGIWVLLLETLDLSRQTENFEAIRRGRDFLREYDGAGRMFEPVWEGHST
ncbi:hypothetical protein P8R33_09760 [Qipengyuania sp. XHP0211]|uniref:hypothetical protein n=1 Tax=Qipengyuania sp. XHP0211 TaxID=3038079 RepID=UPI0024204E82|nr:hypothetical protein [Qipengyuania sp. XHP0211]MDG5751391.1 hypothetical protein [Qipengyuania sp. XHP0211]